MTALRPTCSGCTRQILQYCGNSCPLCWQPTAVVVQRHLLVVGQPPSDGHHPGLQGRVDVVGRELDPLLYLRLHTTQTCCVRFGKTQAKQGEQSTIHSEYMQ